MSWMLMFLLAQSTSVFGHATWISNETFPLNSSEQSLTGKWIQVRAGGQRPCRLLLKRSCHPSSPAVTQPLTVVTVRLASLTTTTRRDSLKNVHNVTARARRTTWPLLAPPRVKCRWYIEVRGRDVRAVSLCGEGSKRAGRGNAWSASPDGCHGDRGGAPDGPLIGGSQCHVDFKKWKCPLSLCL